MDYLEVKVGTYPILIPLTRPALKDYHVGFRNGQFELLAIDTTRHNSAVLLATFESREAAAKALEEIVRFSETKRTFTFASDGTLMQKETAP